MKHIFSIFLLLIFNTVSFGQNKLIKKFLKYNPQLFIQSTDYNPYTFKDIESFKEEIIKHKTKNGEDLSTEFVEFFYTITKNKERER